jgi:predicted GTPase
VSARYTASKTATKDGTSWVIGFRHPLRKDARGKQGRKVRRGLSTDSAERAQLLVDQMNDILGDVTWHNAAKRAEAERQFDDIVVRAFYDDIETLATNSWDVRNEALPLPTAEEGYAHVLSVGTTGVGKTSLLRQLIGSHPEHDRFPSTSASRTTISDIEVIASDDPQFSAVVTFFSEPTVHTNVHECVADACAALWDATPDDKLAERLLTHRDLRFRLGYVIGSWKQAVASKNQPDDAWNYDENDGTSPQPDAEADGALPTQVEIEAMQSFLDSCLARIKSLAVDAKEQLLRTLDVDLQVVTGQEKEAAQDLFEDFVQSLPDFDDLVNDILDEVRLRFERIGPGELRTHANGWPLSWTYQSTNREEFIPAVRRFSSNYAPAFGTLLTPLVDGIRIRGGFFPTFTDRRARLVLLDGEGIGHVGDPAAGLASRIARRFADVDVILLVDSAKSPMLEAPASVLRAVAASGYQKKLAFAFTHFDLMKGQANLPTFQAQRAHVLSAVHQKLTSLRDVVGQPAVRAIERELDRRCFMLGFLDRVITEKQRGPVSELLKLVDFCEAAITPVEVAEACPMYDTAGLVLAIQAAATEFHARWDAILFTGSSGIRKAHWTEVKAMNRRVVLDIDDGEYKDLKPVADLVARLSEWITKFLDKPIRWEPRSPSESESDAARAQVQRAVFSRLHAFVEHKLLRVPRKDWMRAFDYRGRGSTYDRASVIRMIYEASAPIPGPALDTHSEEFLREVRVLLHDAIREGGGELVSDVLGAARKSAH